MINFSARCMQWLKSVSRGIDDTLNNPSLNKEDAANAVSDAFVQSLKQPSFRTQFANLVRNNYLSGLSTVVKNIIGNTVRFIELPLARAVAGRPGEALDILKGYSYAFQKVFPRFMRGIRDHTVEIDGETRSKYDFWLQMPGQDPSEMNTATKAANMLLAWPSKLQRGVDDAYSTMFEHAQLEVMLHRVEREAQSSENIRTFLAKRNTTPGRFIDDVRTALKQSKADDRLFDTLRQVAPDWAQEIDDFARYGTFRSKLGDSLIDKGTKAVAQAARDIPELSLVLPFIVTPTNIAKFGAGYIPGIGLARYRQGLSDIRNLENGIAKLRYKLDEAKTPGAAKKLEDRILKLEGEVQFKKDLNRDFIGQQVLGTGMVVWAYGMVQDNTLTGAMPSDPAERARWQAEGKPEFSVKVNVPGVGPRWISYAGMEPIQTVLGTVASSFDAIGRAQREGKDLVGTAKEFGDVIRAAFLDKTFTQSLSDMMLAIQDPDRVDSFLVGLTNGFTPNWMNTIARLEDPIIRETRDPNLASWIVNNLKSKVPVLRRELPEAVNVMGEQRTISPSGVITGIPVSPVISDATRKVLDNPELRIMPPSRDLYGYKLSADQYAEMSSMIGAYSKQVAESLGSNPGFLALSDRMQAKMYMAFVSEIRSKVRLAYVRQVVQDPAAYRQIVAKELYKRGVNPYTEGYIVD
jgi:hypothetical protein